MTIKIGITSQKKFNKNGYSILIQSAYADSVIRAGYIPVIIPITDDEKLINEYIEMVDGVIICGGSDINPWYYNEQPLQQIGDISLERDDFEIKVINATISQNKKLLGICRGCQLINVIMGGTLYQDIYSQIAKVCGHSPDYMSIDRSSVYHYVEIKDNGILYNLVKTKRLGVNSFHHQAVKGVANSFHIAAVSDDGIIEAIESDNGKILGIQWHPEEMTGKNEQALNIFKEFFIK